MTTDLGERDKPRVLLMAEAANPQWVSVPLVGWSHTAALRRVVSGHLVTHVRNRDAILATGLVEGEDFTAIDSDAVARPLYRLGSLLRGGANKGWTTMTALTSLSYYYFEWLVWKEFGERLARGDFDVVHRVTPLSPATPSLMARWCARVGVPFVVGPLNGGVPWPRQFQRTRWKEREWLSYVRSAYKLLPGYRATRRHAAAIIVGSQTTWHQVPQRYRDRCVYLPENAIDPERFTARRRRAFEPPMRVAFVGRLVPLKGADMLLEAAAPLVRSGLIEVDLIGDGPMRGEAEAIIEREGIGDRARLVGWLEHDQLRERLADYDVLAFPSIREFGGGAVVEAMALGLVPVVVAYGGPAEIVTPLTGRLVPMGSRDEIITGFRTALAELAANPQRVDELGAAAAQRVRRHFTWEAKAAQVVSVYRWVMGQSAKPQFGMPLADEPSFEPAREIVPSGTLDAVQR